MTGATTIANATASGGVCLSAEGLTIEEIITILSDVYQMTEVFPNGEDD